MSFLKSKSVIIEGHKIYLDSMDSLRLSINKNYEPSKVAIVKREIKKGDVVVDIGANIGYYTLIFARLVGNNGHVYAFEPEPENFSILKKNIEVNGYKNVTLVNKAVSNKNCKIKFYLCDDNKAMHTTNKSSYAKFSHTINVDCIKLDDYFKDHKISFMKIDVEGLEYNVVKGMDHILKRNKSIKIMSEFAPILIKDTGIKPQEFLDLLIENDFLLFDLDEKSKLTSTKELLNKYKPKNGKITNILCIRRK